MSTDTADHARLWELIKDTRFGMFTHRHGDDGLLHSHPLTTQNRSVDEDYTLYFFVPKDGVIAQHLHDDVVNVAYANPDDDSYVSVAGRAALVDDQALKRALFNSAARPGFRPARTTRTSGSWRCASKRRVLGCDGKQGDAVAQDRQNALSGDGKPQLGEHKRWKDPEPACGSRRLPEICRPLPGAQHEPPRSTRSSSSRAPRPPAATMPYSAPSPRPARRYAISSGSRWSRPAAMSATAKSLTGRRVTLKVGFTLE